MKSLLTLALHHLAQSRPDDIRRTVTLAAALAGSVALAAQIDHLSRNVDANARETKKLWAETDDIRTKLFAIGEDFVDALSSPPPSDGAEL